MTHQNVVAVEGSEAGPFTTTVWGSNLQKNCVSDVFCNMAALTIASLAEVPVGEAT